ncbi:hypothetical protein H4R18_001546 [Coemansia javaensis]|uniref:Exportin-4 n=1 Tax=Coemansia javaensis TaxID=2761396 RepID=A0A9W8HFB7_9FUNG|nr:hypothetical protein H4R18_001546 [Coemansia javaensis]
MDYSGVLDELEQACADFQVPTTRYAAEQLLLRFGKRPDAIAAGKYVLVHSGVPTAKFFALRGIKDAVVAGYAVLGLAGVLALRDELLQMALADSRGLESFVLGSLCWTVAVITKRAWIDASEEQRMAFTRALCEDIVRHDTPCIGIIAATYLIDEMSGGSKCSEFRLPWEFHYTCKATFENTHMLLLFEAALRVIHSQLQRSIEAQRGSAGTGDKITYERRSALHIADRVLSWEFTAPSESEIVTASFGSSGGVCVAGGPSGAGQQNAARASGPDDDDDGDEGDVDSNDGDMGGAMSCRGSRNRTPLFPSSWQPLLLSSEVLTMFFSVYEAALGDQMHAHFSTGSSHVALQCLIQISGIRGKTIFSPSAAATSDALRIEFSQTIIRNQLQMIRHVCSMDLAAEASEDMIVATTQMVRRFIETQLEEQPQATGDSSNQPLHPLAFLVAHVLEALEYFGEVSKLICMLLSAASRVLQPDGRLRIDDDFGDVDDYFVMQAFDDLASAWSAVIGSIREWQHREEAAAAAAGAPMGRRSGFDEADSCHGLGSLIRLLNTTGYLIRSEYIQLRMLMCQSSVGSGGVLSEDLLDGQGPLAKDYLVYEDQLLFFALLARLDVHTALDCLYNNLRSRHSALQKEFSALEGGADGGGGDPAVDDEHRQHAIDLLHDQTQWIALMIAYTLCDSGASERVLIPRPILDCSSASPGPDRDLVVQCIMGIFGLLELELAGPASVLAVYGSPLLVETLFWALRRIVPVYVLLDRSDYQVASPSIVAAFGCTEDSGRGAAVTSGILGLVRHAFERWPSEEDVLQMCTSMLLALAQRPALARQIISAPQFAPLMQYLTAGMGGFPEAVHGSIIEALALLVCHSPADARERGFADLRALIVRCFSQVVQSKEYAAQSQDARLTNQLLDGLDMMDGLLSAANFRNMGAVLALFFELAPLLEQLLGTYPGGHEVACKAVQVMESAARYLDVSSFPDDEHAARFSRCLRSLLQKYYAANRGRVVSQAGADVESLGETTALISTVSYLVRNEMGFSSNEADCAMSRLVSDDFGETEAFGVYCIHTMTEPAQLLVPNVLQMHTRLLSEMVQYRLPSLMRWLPAKVWVGAMDVLLASVDSAIYDIGQRAYEAIGKLGAYVKIRGMGDTAAELRDVLDSGFKRLLSRLLYTLLFSPFDVGLVESAGAALVTLGLIDPAHLQSCFQELLAQSRPADLAGRLSATLAKFTADLEASRAVAGFLAQTGPIPDPIDGGALRQPLFEFLVNARAVLRIR